MCILRADIERALNELVCQEGGMRFQGLAVVLGKKRWPELIACERKSDLGLDAYASANLTHEHIGKGLAASITSKKSKILCDVKTAKQNFPDLKKLLFVTSGKIANSKRKLLEEAILKNCGVELQIIEREEIVMQMMMPENASLCTSFLYLNINAQRQMAELVDRTRRAAHAITQTWKVKTKGHPLIHLTIMKLDQNGADSSHLVSLEQIDRMLLQNYRIILEGPAGAGKTTTLIQLAQHSGTIGIRFILELSGWILSGQRILEYMAGMPAFQAEGLTAGDLASAQKTQPFLFLLNGWNEISESNSIEANNALQELERDFSSAGIIIATRTHHLTPPLPDVLRLRLLPLRRMQRVNYLTARLDERGTQLSTSIDADPSLDELTRRPFILSEVVSLFEAGDKIPSTKIEILGQVVHLQERRAEHRNALQTTPIFAKQEDYLRALATKIISHGGISLPEGEARAIIFVVARKLASCGQIELVGASAILAALTAHHVLERIDYPQIVFQFEHQQLRDYYAALDLHAQLLELQHCNHNVKSVFAENYVNDVAWEEPLRMMAEAFSQQTGDGETDRKNTLAGTKLVLMALTIDPIFAAELAQLCGVTVWNEVRPAVSDCLRFLYRINDSNYQDYAVAAMLATGADDFSDIILPLLSGQDHQVGCQIYQLWPDMHVSSLGANWREEVCNWSEEVRANFVSGFLGNHVNPDIVAFAAEDKSALVKEAAVFRLMRTRSEDALIRVIKSMDVETFDKIARQNSDSMPMALRSRVVSAMRKFIENSSDHLACLRTVLDLINIGELDIENIVKNVMALVPSADISNLSLRYIQPALEYLGRVDPAWVSEWIASKIADGILSDYKYWLPFAKRIPNDLVEKYLRILETEDLKNSSVRGVIAIIVAHADSNHAARVFSKVCQLRHKLDENLGLDHELEKQVMRQLKTLFDHISGDIAVAGILASVKGGITFDIKVTIELLKRFQRVDVEPLCIADADLKIRFRMYLKSCIDLVLYHGDFSQEEKADFAWLIALVGIPEDMVDLVKLIRSDIQMMRANHAALAAGRLVHSMNYFGHQHIASVICLDVAGAEQVLIDLLREPEYLLAAVDGMVRDFLPKSRGFFNCAFRYDLMWTAREGCIPPFTKNHRQRRFSKALNEAIKRLLEENRDGKTVAKAKQVAKALAIIDGPTSAAVVLNVIAMPDQFNNYWSLEISLEVAERLLIAGVVLPASSLFALIDCALGQTEKSRECLDRKDLLHRILRLCPFVDDPAAGIRKMQDLLRKWQLLKYKPCELIMALGESRSDAAVDLLFELASDALTFKECESNFIKALGTLDTPRAHQLLLAFVDPKIKGISLTGFLSNEEALVMRLTELAQQRTDVAASLRKLCEYELPEFNREVLSKVMDSLGTPEALVANLKLIDDTRPSPVPQGMRNQLRSAFLQRQPYGENPNVFIEHACASNELRVQLFKMAKVDKKRQRSAFMLLGQIEKWRLEYGRPTDEPRHPDPLSPESWPPKELWFSF